MLATLAFAITVDLLDIISVQRATDIIMIRMNTVEKLLIISC